MRASSWRLGGVVVLTLLGLPVATVALDDYRAPDPMAPETSPHVLDIAFDPAWSPDGSRLAFAGSRGGVWGIYVVDADGSALTRLTEGQQPDEPDARVDSQPAWSPDGTSIAFTGDREGVSGIYRRNGDGE